MKILFLCGSLERGKDGVGDYTRRLAVELIRQGNVVYNIAIFDNYVKTESEEIDIIEDFELRLLRLPSVLPGKKRIQRVREKIEETAPDWISVQFVPFSFHPKGLPFWMQGFLKTVRKGRKLQIMLHELWVGMHEEASIKWRAWGWVQQRIIIKLIKNLKPEIVNTQIELYKKMLEQYGIAAEVLPLFGNIPVTASELPTEKSSGIMSFVVFGTIFPNTPILKFTSELALIAREKKLEVELTMLGRNGGEADKWKQIWETQGFRVRMLGERPENIISQVLSTASFGIATTSYPLIMKSGSVAAMLEHRLRVICVSSKWKLRNSNHNFSVPQVVEFEENSLRKIICSQARVSGFKNVGEVGSVLLNSFDKFDKYE